jgi:uncharacterized protein
MSVLPRALAWHRTDTNGAEFTAYDDRRGFVARGTAISSDPVTYACRYELITDDGWVSTRFEASVEGAGWLRTVRMERAAGRWRVTTAEQGNLDALAPSSPFPGSEDPDRLTDAMDVDLYASPLTNTLPIRRLGLIGRPPGTERTITAAWILLPSLAVLPLEQTYTVLGPGKMRYASEGFTADLDVDDEGFVTYYPGLARRHKN